MTITARNTALRRDLDAGELRELVGRIAADPGQWRPLVRGDTPQRHFEQLWRDDHVDVWVITWASGNDTGFHDHDVSHGAVAVVQGELIEERLVVGGPPSTSRSSTSSPSTTATAPLDTSWSWKPVSLPFAHEITHTSTWSSRQSCSKWRSPVPWRTRDLHCTGSAAIRAASSRSSSRS